MNRRSFLTTSLLAAPAVLTLTSLPALADTTGSTLVEAPGLSASGTFDIPGFTAGGNGIVNMHFASGPSVAAQFGPSAVDHMRAAQVGDRFAVRYVGFNGNDEHRTEWNIEMGGAAAAGARFRVDGALEARASALIGGDQWQGTGFAAMVVAAMSAGSTLRGAPASQLQALVRSHSAPSGMAFGLEVTVSA